MTCCTHLNLIPGLQSFCPTCEKTIEPCQHKEHYHYGKRTATKSAATQANPRANQRRQGLEQKELAAAVNKRPSQITVPMQVLISRGLIKPS